jgi:hypothetical protein
MLMTPRHRAIAQEGFDEIQETQFQMAPQILATYIHHNWLEHLSVAKNNIHSFSPVSNPPLSSRNLPKLSQSYPAGENQELPRSIPA